MQGLDGEDGVTLEVKNSVIKSMRAGDDIKKKNVKNADKTVKKLVNPKTIDDGFTKLGKVIDNLAR